MNRLPIEAALPVSRIAEVSIAPSKVFSKPLISNRDRALDRRGLLGGLAAALGFGAAANVAVAVQRASGATAPDTAFPEIDVVPPLREYPLVVALAPRTDQLKAEYLAARGAADEALRWAQDLAPAVPDALIRKQGDCPRELWDCAEELLAIDGSYINLQEVVGASEKAGPAGDPAFPRHGPALGTDGKRRVQMAPRVFRLDRMRKVLPDFPARSDIGRRLRRLIPIAERYERSRRNAVRVSGLKPARAEVDRLTWEIVDLARDASRLVPRSSEGLAIIARVALLPSVIGGDTTMRYQVKQIMAEPLADDAIRVAAMIAAGLVS